MYKEPCKEGDVVGDKARVKTRGYDEVDTCRITESAIEREMQWKHEGW